MSDLNLLTDPLLHTRSPSGELEAVSLPEVLSRLGAGENLEFSGLRSHQQHAWHAFLVQVAALITHPKGGQGLDRPAHEWRQELLDLAGDAGEDAWCLVVADPARPAFFQNPAPEGHLKAYKRIETAPDDIDIVITTRNHDIKQSRMARPRPEHWIFALVTLQTMEGFLGRGNYGIARMNGGFASRPALALAPGLGWSERFRRDVATWCQARSGILDGSYGYPHSGGHALLWTVPWDGGKSCCTLPECDPFFLEVCRRVRLVRTPRGRLEARLAPTSAAFLDAKTSKGDTGEIWTPVKKDGPALTVSGGGFSYRLMTELLFSGNFHRPPALASPQAGDEEPVLVAQVLARGQGKTDGYHERLLPVPRKVSLNLGNEPKRAALGDLAQARVEDTRNVQRRVLHLALCALLQGGKETLNLRDAHTEPWIRRMDAAVDRIFFEDLWADAEAGPDEARGRWHRRLRQLAATELEDAIASAPIPLAVYPKAVARAEGLFWGLLKKHFPDALDTTATHTGDPATEESTGVVSEGTNR